MKPFVKVEFNVFFSFQLDIYVGGDQFSSAQSGNRV